MAHALARELGAPLELAPVPRDELVEVLEANRVDVVMAGILVTTRRAARVVPMPLNDPEAPMSGRINRWMRSC